MRDKPEVTGLNNGAGEAAVTTFAKAF